MFKVCVLSWWPTSELIRFAVNKSVIVRGLYVGWDEQKCTWSSFFFFLGNEFSVDMTHSKRLQRKSEGFSERA